MGPRRLLGYLLVPTLLVAVASVGLGAAAAAWSPWPAPLSFVAIGVSAALLAWLASWRASQRLTLELERLRRGTNRYARGDLSHKLAASDIAEVADLADTITRMAVDVEGRLRELVRQRNEREAVLASMVEGVLAVDADERLMNLNQAGADLIGVDWEHAVGRSLPEVVRNPALQRLVSDVLVRKHSSSDEIELALPDGERRILHAQGSVFYDAQERPIGALVVLHDVTQLKRLENVRRDFVANVSHELRTPVTSIKGFVETLLDGAMDHREDAERFLRIVAAQADRLNAIIEDLLTLSRIEQEEKQIEIALETARLQNVLAAAIQVCQFKADEKEIVLALSCDDNLQARINPVLLEQAVANLIDNAVKYSPNRQQVLVEARRTGTEIEIRVMDHGCGIGREHLPRIFERFYRVDKARSRQLGGTGLGLAIVKHIVQAHGGRTTVKSAPGEGSTFCIHLPGQG
jgi:two-component system phosphate regulon sensor histidine kinase PhoR